VDREEASISHHLQNRFRKNFELSLRGMVNHHSTARKKMNKTSTTTCSTKTMKLRIMMICFLEMTKRCRCSKKWRIKKQQSCKSNSRKKALNQ
jgi:hypothetical protein